MVLTCLVTMQPTFAARDLRDKLTDNDQEVLVTNDINDPFRDWANNPAEQVDNLYYNWQINTFLQAQNETLGFIQRMINWALSVLGVIALVYLLYHGFLMVTAAWDDAQYKKWAKAVRAAFIALVWIWLSALVVNFILYVLSIMMW